MAVRSVESARLVLRMSCSGGRRLVAGHLCRQVRMWLLGKRPRHAVPKFRARRPDRCLAWPAQHPMPTRRSHRSTHKKKAVERCGLDLNVQQSGLGLWRTPVQFVADIGEVQCDGQPFFRSLKPSAFDLLIGQLSTQFTRSPSILLRAGRVLKLHISKYTWVSRNLKE